MKKLFLMFAVVSFLVSCGSSSEENTTTDSTKVAVDSTQAVVDTTKTSTDTTSAPCDTTKECCKDKEGVKVEKSTAH